MTTRHS